MNSHHVPKKSVECGQDMQTMRLDIIGVEYPVALCDNIFQHSGHLAYALCNNQPPSIQISTKAVSSQRLYLLLHEVLHALSYMGHLQFLRDDGDPFRDDEASVDALSSLMSEVITRNKEVFIPLINGREWPETRPDSSR